MREIDSLRLPKDEFRSVERIASSRRSRVESSWLRVTLYMLQVSIQERSSSWYSNLHASSVSHNADNASYAGDFCELEVMRDRRRQ